MDNMKYMPKMLMGEELKEAFTYLPSYDDSIRGESQGDRLIALNELSNIYIPSSMSYEIYSKVYLATMRAMGKKNTLAAIRQGNENHRRIHGMNYKGVLGGSDAFSIIGPSGIGKSTTLLKSVELCGGMDVITTNEPCNEIIPCILVQCPHDNSVKSLMLAILKEIDMAIGTSLFENAIKARASIDVLITHVAQQLMLHGALLIIDECQNLCRNTKGASMGGVSLVASLTQLINSSGISICLVGLPKTMELFGQEMQLARRNMGLCYKELPYGDAFIHFCETIWKYQYVSHTTMLDEKTLVWLHEHSNGVISIVVSLIMEAQQIAILNGMERLDLASLTIAYDERMQSIQDFIAPKKVASVSKASKAPMQLSNKDDKVGQAIIEDGETFLQSIIVQARKDNLDVISLLRENGITICEVAM